MDELDTQAQKKLLEEDILHQFPSVFSSLGRLQGEYHMDTEPGVKPVQHASRKVPETTTRTGERKTTRKYPKPRQEQVRDKLQESIRTTTRTGVS